MPPLSDTEIINWQDDYLASDTNGPANADMISTQLGDQVRNIKSVERAESELKQWERHGLTATYISATSFSFAGDKRTTAVVGRRIKVTISGSTKYGTILSSSFGASKTTVTAQWDLEEYTAHAFTFVNPASVSFPTDVTAAFPTALRVEFWTVNGAGTAGDRIGRVVNTSSYSAPNTTVSFLSGAPYVPLALGHQDVLMVPSAGITNTIADVAFGVVTPDLFQSGWGHTIATGTFTVTANGAAGPFTVPLAATRVTNSYVVQIQALNSNTAPSNTQWANPKVSARTTTNFAVTFPVALTAGPVMTFDFVILEQA